MNKILATIVALAIAVAAIVFLLRDKPADTPQGEPAAALTDAGTQDTADAAEDAMTVEAEDSAAALDEALEATGEALESAADAVTESAQEAVAVVEETAQGLAGSTGETTADETIRPSFDVVRVEPSGDAVMAGRAAPGARVSVMTQDGVLAQTQADGNGEWVIVLDEPLTPGNHEIWLRGEGTDGMVSESREAVVMTIPGGEDIDVAGSDQAQGQEAQDQETLSESGQGVDGGVLAVTVPREDSESAVTVLQAPSGGVGIAGGGALTLDSLSYDESGAVSLSGRAEPGAQVLPYIDGEIAGSVQADDEGNWNLTLDQTLDAGRHELRVDQVDEKGDVMARIETPIQQAAYTMPTSAEPLVVIQPGNNLWLIARHVYGKGTLYTQIFEANRDQIGDPDLIFPGQIFVVPQADQTGG